MPDFLVFRETPTIFTAATVKAAIGQALDTMPEYNDANGSFTVTLWVGPAGAGQLVTATVDVTKTRTLTIGIVP